MKNQQIQCPKCNAKYRLKNAFEKHMEKQHPFKKHISYIELLKHPGQWGYTYEIEKEAKEFERSPADFALHMAYLSQIWKTLNQILEELRRAKTIK